MRHHTKDKGDLAVGEVIADLFRAGAQVCLPISEHLPFDLLAVDPSLHDIKRVQVRYIATRQGAIHLRLRQTYADRHGVHARLISLDDVDAFAIFCPDGSEVYYVRREEIRGAARVTFNLRVQPSANGQRKHIRAARDFKGAKRIFGPVAQRTEQRISNPPTGGSNPSGPARFPSQRPVAPPTGINRPPT